MKNTALKFINPILLVLFLIAAVSMLLYRFGPESIRGSETLYTWHSFSGILFFFVGIIHLIYNWAWVRTNILKKKKRRQ